MNNLANMYYNGTGVDVNYEEALRLYTAAANLNYYPAMNNLADMYYTGRGTDIDFVKARELYEKAISLNNQIAILNLAVIYFFGKGIEIDHEKAFTLYQKLSEFGNKIALNNLAYMYAHGYHVEINYQQAVILFKQSIELNNKGAMSNLVEFYKNNLDKFSKEEIISYFINKNSDKLKIIFNYDDDMISYLKRMNRAEAENVELKKIIEELKKTNSQLVDHINYSPDGKKYLGLLHEWNTRFAS